MIDVLVLNYNDAMTTLNYVNKIKTYKNVRHASIVTYVLALIMSRISLVEIGLWSLVHKR